MWLFSVHDLMWRNGSMEARGIAMHNGVYGSFGWDGDSEDWQTACKGYAEGYGSYFNHIMLGNTPESWSGFSKFEKKCGNKKTEKSMMKCLIKFFKMDPIIQIDVGNDTNEDLKELTLLINEINLNLLFPVFLSIQVTGISIIL